MKRQSISKIELQNVTYEPVSGRTLFSNVTIDVPLNCVTWIRGANGCGKSSFMKLLCGLIEPTAGRLLINGQNVSDMSFEEFLPYRLNLGYSFDFGGLINNRTIHANLALPLEYHSLVPANEINNRVAELISRFDLDEAANERPSSIVGGLRKAACVARAFVTEPEILILDDPSVGLRPKAKRATLDLIKTKLQSGGLKGVVIASEDSQWVSELKPKELVIQNQTLKIAELAA